LGDAGEAHGVQRDHRGPQAGFVVTANKDTGERLAAAVGGAAGGEFGGGEKFRHKDAAVFPEKHAAVGGLEVDSSVFMAGTGKADSIDLILFSESVNRTKLARRKQITSMSGMISRRTCFVAGA